MNSSKYLSIVTCVRRVSADPTWIHRLCLYVQNLVSYSQKYDLEAELIIVNWNPIQSSESIAEVLGWIPNTSSLEIKVIDVPSQVHHQIENSDRIDFYQYIGVNVGIRRSIGEFVLVTSIDILFSEEIIRFLSEKRLDRQAYYRVNRHDVKVASISPKLSLEEKINECEKNRIRIHTIDGTKEIQASDAQSRDASITKALDEANEVLRSQAQKPHTVASGDFMLMARDAWIGLKGYPEIPKSQLYIDGLIVYMASVSGLQQVVLPDPPMRVYHLDHPGTWIADRPNDKSKVGIDYQTEYLPWCRQMLQERQPLDLNSSDWGLGQENLQALTIAKISEQQPLKIQLDNTPVCVDLGCGSRKSSGYIGVDIVPCPGVDIVADLTQTLPFEESSVDRIKAHDIIEHLPDKLNTMNEIWRIGKPGAKVDILVPSTDGRGAFQDPTHVSFWNINSFFYYCIDYPDYYELGQRYGFKGCFKVSQLQNISKEHQVVYVSAQLEVIKPDRPENTEPKVSSSELQQYEQMISALEKHQRRLYYRDQTPQSLYQLTELVRHNQPTKIVELGSLFGLSLRTWLSTNTEAEIIAIDLSFRYLHLSQQIIPIDLSRVKLLEQDILKTDFSQLWNPQDKVLLYIDAHDLAHVPIMKYLLNHALPILPRGSIVVVDDLWYSPETLSKENDQKFFETVFAQELDPLHPLAASYAPYWEGGSFFGFLEVIPLLDWINQNQIKLNFRPQVKSVSFTWFPN
jgi:SAM-dependent methyltransferase